MNLALMVQNHTEFRGEDLDNSIQTLYIKKGHFMASATVNISFNSDILQQIDEIAKSEARSRSELIREAARLYIERKKKWESIFAYGESLASNYGFTENDVNEEIKKYRKEKNQKSK